MIELPHYPVTDEEMKRIDALQGQMRERMRSVPKEGRNIQFRGRTYFVLPGVFWPQVDDSGIGSCTPILDYYRIELNEEVLDFGTGSGVLAIDAARRGKGFVVGVDINPLALETTGINASRHNVSLQVYSPAYYYANLATRGSRYNHRERFIDVMIGNLPFRNKPAHDEVEATMWDTDFVAHREFFSFADRYLKHNGRIYLAQANFGGVEEMLELAEQHGYVSRLIGATYMPGDDPRVFYAFEMTRR